jgi:hypothetical protein
MTVGTYFIIPTLLVIFLSLLIVRAASVALVLTGLDQRRAWFQALSAFTGTGFTTREAESVVNHVTRRRIISALMLVGNVGIVTVIIAATSVIVHSEGPLISLNIILLILGAYIIYRIGNYKGFNQKWDQFARIHLIPRLYPYGNVVEEQFEVSADYGVVKAAVVPGSALAEQQISDLELGDDMIVLGIQRGKRWISHPRSNEVVKSEDSLVVYGPLEDLQQKFR